MDDPTLNNRGAPPATDAQGNAKESWPLLPPMPGQPAPSSPQDVPPLDAGEQTPWPSIPDMPPDMDSGQAVTLSQPAPGVGPIGYPLAQSPSPQRELGGFPPLYPGSADTPTAGYPGGASQVNYPSMPAPTMPGSGSSLPASYPGYTGYPSLPLSPSMPLGAGWKPVQPRSPLARPFPFWVSLLLTVGMILLAALVYVADETLIRGDWAAGARAAGVSAFILAGLTVLLLVVRLSVGRRAASTVILSLLLAVLLIGAGASGIALANPLHGLQAQTLERGGDWSGAIYEYELKGEQAPNAPNIARIYDEWGEQDLQQKSYKDAVTRFTIVITQYGQSGAPVDRAQTDLFETFTTWVQANDPSVPYGDAIADLVAYRSNPQCDATCQTTSKAVEAQARYEYGVQLLARQQYSAAVQQLELVQSQFATSPYAKQAHLAAAQAYFALGQQQLQSSCSDAVPTYQTLAKQYGDTPEGGKAKSALAAPQSVSGNISGYADPNRTVYLSRSVNISADYYSQDYQATVDSSGSFTFKNVAQGKYNLSAAPYTSGSYTYYEYWEAGQDLYPVHVVPLCPTQIGQLKY